jgi:H+/gluconate symporter-like permease
LDILIVLLALGLLIFVAYRGFSVIVFAPVAALFAVVLTEPFAVLPFYSGVFMDKLGLFVKLYFPLFLLGALFGKLMELSGFAHSLVRAILSVVGPERAILSVVVVCAVLTYGGVSLFVVIFAVYPFAAELYRNAGVPKRLLPATVALGAFTFTMDALPGSPQVQNLIPTTFFSTDAWAAPEMGIAASIFLFGSGLAYLEWRFRAARKAGEGYGEGHMNEPLPAPDKPLPHWTIALSPLLTVAAVNLLMGRAIRGSYGETYSFARYIPNADPIEIGKVAAIWSVQVALFVAALFALPFAFRASRKLVPAGVSAAVGGAMLGCLNVASEYGFGGVIAALPGFHAIQTALSNAITNPLLNVAATTNVLAAVTGSSSGGLSLTLAAMGEHYLEMARGADIPAEVLHRVATLASGGMDTLPHNGAIITLLAITGLTHRQAYKDIFAMTGLKVAAAFVGIAYYTALNRY